MLSLIFKILEKDQIFVELCRVKHGYYNHRNIYYDFCIVCQERVKAVNILYFYSAQLHHKYCILLQYQIYCK